VGVMWGLAWYGNSQDYHWDVVSGISAGAINSAGTAGFAPYEVLEMTDYLSYSWFNQTNDDVWKVRDLNPIDLAFHQPSILDDSPGLEHIRNIMSLRSEFKRRVSVGAVDQNSGDFVEFN